MPLDWLDVVEEERGQQILASLRFDDEMEHRAWVICQTNVWQELVPKKPLTSVELDGYADVNGYVDVGVDASPFSCMEVEEWASTCLVKPKTGCPIPSEVNLLDSLAVVEDQHQRDWVRLQGDQLNLQQRPQKAWPTVEE